MAQAFDPTALKFADAELPTRTRSAGDSAPNPMVPVLKDSYENSKAKAVTVANAKDAKALVSLLRGAADELGIGSRIVTLPKLATGKGAVQPTGRIKVTFAGVDRKKFSPRKRKGDATETATVGAPEATTTA